MAGHEMNRPAASLSQDRSGMKVDVQNERRLQQQWERPAKPHRLHLLDIVQYRIGGAGQTNPFLTLAEPEKFMRRDEDAQIERLLGISGLVSLDRLDSFGAQAQGQHVGDFAHEEITERTAKDPDTDMVFSQQPRRRPAARIRERIFCRVPEAVSLGFDLWV